MVKVTKSKSGQYRVTIPKEIIKLTGWTDKTEVVFIPHIKSPTDKMNKNTPIILKEVPKGGKK